MSMGIVGEVEEPQGWFFIEGGFEEEEVLR